MTTPREVLAELRALEAHATVAPWEIGPDPDEHEEMPDYRGYVDGGDGTVVRPGISNPKQIEDAAFIAAVRNATPMLLELAESAIAAREQAIVQRHGDHIHSTDAYSECLLCKARGLIHAEPVHFKRCALAANRSSLLIGGR